MERETRLWLKHDVLREIVKQIARLGTCRRSKVGALIVKDGRIISTGYNGSPPGELHCLEAGCIMEDNHCVRCTHAESNAIAFAAKEGRSTFGASILVYGWVTGGNLGICKACNKLAKAAGIEEIIIIPVSGEDPREIQTKKVSRFDEHNCNEKGCVNVEQRFQNETKSNLPDDITLVDYSDKSERED